MPARIKAFIKKEAVLCIAAVCAVATMLAVPPDKEYLTYIDFRVLCLLMCLMAVVAGFKSVGVFRMLTYQLLSRIKSRRLLSITLVMLPFFISMLVTNDVALIVFIPFTLGLLSDLGCKKETVPIIVLQTVAANLGSMATPVGNPQNLFLYSAYNLSAVEFFSCVLPLTAISFIILAAAAMPVLPKSLPEQSFKRETIDRPKNLIIYAVLFILCLLTVFRVIPYVITTVIVVIVFILADRRILKEIDFMLLLTFVCFFIVSENLGRVEAIRGFLQMLLQKNTLLTAVGASQVISNVPAAILLSTFTDNWKELLAGVNIGGLGTPIASLASLITLKIYMQSEDSKVMRFLGVFAAANIAGLLILLSAEFLIK